MGRDNYERIKLSERSQFKMIVKTFIGKEKKRDLTNSDLVMQNNFFYKFQDILYTPECLAQFIEET